MWSLDKKFQMFTAEIKRSLWNFWCTPAYIMKAKRKETDAMKKFGKWKQRLLALLMAVVFAMTGSAAVFAQAEQEEDNGGAAAEEVVVAATRAIPFLNNGKVRKAEVDWNEHWFGRDATVYNHSLGTAAAALAASCYGETITDGSHAKEALKALGVSESDIEQSYPTDYVQTIYGYNRVAYSIGSKRAVIDEKGTEKELIFVLVRGTPGNIEWVSNNNVSNMTEKAEAMHEGFNRAASEVEAVLAEYLAGRINHEEEPKILITGHSRGAAVANILGASIDKSISRQEGSFKELKKADVFTYTFATPNTTHDKIDKPEQYANIFNIVNPEDAVPRVPMNSVTWKYRKFGTTRYLPSKTNTWIWDYWELYDKMNAYFKGYTDRDYVPFWTGASVASAITKSIHVLGVTPYFYYNFFWGNKPHDWTSHAWVDYLLKCVFKIEGNEKSYQELYDESPAAARGLLTLLRPVIDSDAFENSGAYDIHLADAFVDMHAGGTYVAWMQAGNEVIRKTDSQEPHFFAANTTVVSVAGAKALKAKTDDVIVADMADGTVDRALLSRDGLATEVDPETGVTSVHIPLGAPITLEIQPDGHAPVSIQIKECTPDGIVLSQVNYTEIDSAGTEMLVLSKQEPETASAAAYGLTIGSCAVEPNEVLAADSNDGDLQNQVVEVRSSDVSKGSAWGSAVVTKGSLLAVHAEANDGFVFSGWYRGTEKVSDSSSYILCVQDSQELTAGFEQKAGPTPVPDPTPKPIPSPEPTPADNRNTDKKPKNPLTGALEQHPELLYGLIGALALAGVAGGIYYRKRKQ